MLKRLLALCGVVTLGWFGAVMLAGPAQAHHNTVDWARTGGECGMTTFTTTWAEADHVVANTVLIVQWKVEDGEFTVENQTVAEIGNTVTVGPFTETGQGRVVVRWRVWGGGERAHDDPQLKDLNALLGYLDDHPGGELDVDPPGVAWRNRTVEGCPPAQTPSPSPSASPSESPQPEPEPTKTQDAGKAGSLPVTGDPVWIFAGVGAGLLVLGAGLYFLARSVRART